jgi:hypothetical protein
MPVSRPLAEVTDCLKLDECIGLWAPIVASCRRGRNRRRLHGVHAI